MSQREKQSSVSFGKGVEIQGDDVAEDMAQWIGQQGNELSSNIAFCGVATGSPPDGVLSPAWQ